MRFVRDVAAITMDTNDVETIEFHALGGADKITVGDLSGTDVTKVAIDLAGTLGGAAGDGQADTVLTNGTNGDDTVTLSFQNGARVVDGLAAQVVIDHFESGDTLRIATLGGNDVIDASARAPGGPDLVIDGGAGSDTVSYAAASHAMLINLTGQVTTDGIVTDTLSSIENAVGSAFGDIIGNDSGNGSTADRGPDVRRQRHGVLRPLGARRADQSRGRGGGRRDLHRHAAPRSRTPSARPSTTSSTATRETTARRRRRGSDRIDGRGGSDTVSYDLSARGQLINLAGEAAADGIFTDTFSSIENAIGTKFSDVMHGNALDNVLDGGAGGSDQINGAGGSDTVSYVFSHRGHADQPGGASDDRRRRQRYAVLDRERHRLGLRRRHREQRRGKPTIDGRGGSRHGVLRSLGARPADQSRRRGGDRRHRDRHLLLDRERDRHTVRRPHRGRGGCEPARGQRRRTTPSCFSAAKRTGDTVVDFAGNGAGAGDAFWSSSATARAQPSSRSTERTGRSTPATASRTRRSRCKTPPPCTKATCCSCETSHPCAVR